MKITRIYWSLIIFVVGIGLFGIGYGLGSNFPLLKTLANGGYEQGFKDGMDNAQKIVAASNVFPPEPLSVTAITGTVKSIDNDTITIAAAPISPNPLTDQGPKTRVITIAATTPIVALVNKTAAEMQADFKQFQADSKNGKTTAPPSPYHEVTSSLADLKLTMVVTVYAASDVRDAPTITAEKISFQTY